MKINSKKARKLAVIAAIFIFPALLSGSILINNSLVNWDKGYIVSKGKASITFEQTGAPVDNTSRTELSINHARKKIYSLAKEKAIENMIETIKTVRVDPEIKMIELIEQNRITQKNLSESLDHLIFREYPSGFDSSICEAKLEFGDLIASIPYEFPSNDIPEQDDVSVSTSYTSLIVDGRGIDIEPMLFPSIYDNDGLEIYGRYNIISSYAVKGGMASYCFTEQEAYRNYRAGQHPFFAVAVKSIKNCPVLSERDTRRILSSAETRNNLKKCRVIFILDTGRK